MKIKSKEMDCMYTVLVAAPVNLPGTSSVSIPYVNWTPLSQQPALTRMLEINPSDSSLGLEYHAFCTLHV